MKDKLRLVAGNARFQVGVAGSVRPGVTGLASCQNSIRILKKEGQPHFSDGLLIAGNKENNTIIG